MMVSQKGKRGDFSRQQSRSSPLEASGQVTLLEWFRGFDLDPGKIETNLKEHKGGAWAGAQLTGRQVWASQFNTYLLNKCGKTAWKYVLFSRLHESKSGKGPERRELFALWQTCTQPLCQRQVSLAQGTWHAFQNRAPEAVRGAGEGVDADPQASRGRAGSVAGVRPPAERSRGWRATGRPGPAQLHGSHQGEALRPPVLGPGLAPPICPRGRLRGGMQRPSERAEASSFPHFLLASHS